MRPSQPSFGKNLLANHTRLVRWFLALSGAAAAGVVIGNVIPESTIANLPKVDLSSDPLYQRGVTAKPTLTLALSVEYPTVGAAYVKQYSSRFDDTYSADTEYLGYFDSRGCYEYAPSKKYFSRVADASSSHTCTGEQYSGNFMNWASASAIDILRMGLTGGDRVVDESGVTILQRANLPDGTHTGNPSFYNSENFPTKYISQTNAVGLLPTSITNSEPDIYVTNCRNMIYIGQAPGGSNSCASPGDSGKYQLQAQVAVCDAADARSRETYLPGYCKKYKSGYYKPVGNLQKYADVVRVAVFGYLVDNNYRTYGGVLRAPMSYIGKRSYDENFALLPNDNKYAEWNEVDGTFYKNPRGAGESVSGAINYINQFGRGNGRYKGYDPVTELYYESLRYLRGMPPTAAAAENINADLKDGFPVYSVTSSDAAQIPTSWGDPHPKSSKITDYSCVKNNILTIGDVNTHNDTRIPGDETRGSVANAGEDSGEEDFKNWTDVVGKFESGSGRGYTDGKGVATRSTSTYPNPNPIAALNDIANSGPTWGDSSSYYMAGMAYWGHTHDIRPAGKAGDRARPGMRITTYAIDVNEYGAQTDFDNHSRNQYYLAAKYGGFTDASGADIGSPYALSSADEAKNPQPDRNNSWQRPAVKREPRNFFLGNEAKQMLDALDNIFADIAKDTGNVAGLAVDSRRVTETKAIYQGRFNPDGWSGDLVSYPIDKVSSGSVFDPQKNATWHAADKLDLRDPASRNIVVGVQENSSTSALNFVWSDVAGKYGDVFATSPDPTVTAKDSLAEQRVNFLRGDRSQEQPGGPLRQRKSVMGDVINSGVVYLGDPTTSITDFDGTYQKFLKDHTGRQALFVGANDGMLHAFDVNGNELFAYIPSSVVPKLNQLTWPKYKHESYVDATPTVAEANLGSSTAANWQTVLVGGTGAGSQGVYALNVSDPTAFSTKNVLWEFTDADDPDLGNVVGRPRILKLKVGSDYKWFAVLGGGVNNYVDDGHVSTSLGDPYIFLLDLSKDSSTPWNLNKNYFKVALPRNKSANIATGVLNIAVVTDADRAALTLYAGDLHGQLWKVNVDAQADLTDLAAQRHQVFDAAHAGKRQPITSAPALFRVEGNIVAVFGTGKFLETGDKETVDGNYATQSVYAVYDGRTGSQRTLTIDDLKKVNVTADKWEGENFAWGVPSSDPDATPKVYAGWYFDFPSGSATGERQIGLMAALPSMVVFNTIIPADNSCSTGGGASYTLSLFTGGGTRVVTTQMLSDPVFLEGNLVTQTNNDRSGEGSKHITIKDCTTDGCTDRDQEISRRLNRVSWRELANFDEIKNRKPSPTKSSSK